MSSEPDDDQAPESITGDELEPVSLRDLRTALGPGTTPVSAPAQPTSRKTPPTPKVAPVVKPAQRPLAPKAPPATRPAPHAPPVKVSDPPIVSARSAPKPPRPPRPPLRSVPDTGADMSAKDLEAFAAMSGSSAPPPPAPPSIPTTPVLAGAASAPPPPLDGALPTRQRHALPKAPPRKALSSQNDEAELARRDAPIAELPGDDSAWQRPPDSGLTDLRQLASLSNPPDRGSIPDDVLAPGALAAPLLPPDLRQLSNEVPLEPPPTSTRSGPPSARKSTKGRRTASGAPSRRATSSGAPARASARPSGGPSVRPSAAPSAAPPAERSRIGLYAIAAITIVGGGIWFATRDDKPNQTPTPSTPPTTTEVIAAPPPTETAAARPPVEPTPEPEPTTTASPEPTHHASDTPRDPRLASTEPAVTPTATATATAKPTATAKATAAPAAGGGEFDKGAASAALSGAVGAASGCKQPGDPSGVARVQVTFAPSGRVTTANLSGPPFAGTPTGSCIARAFRTASVPPFSGDPVTVSKTVTIP